MQVCKEWSLPLLEGWAYASLAEALNPNSLIVTFLDFLEALNRVVLEDAKAVVETSGDAV